MMKSLKANLMDIYEWYVGHEGIDGSRKVSTEESISSTNTCKGSSSTMSDARLNRFLEKQAVKDSIEIKNDVERYLLDARESIENKDFEVLDWWKVNGNKYGVLSNLAKDVLAIQVSTVASESAFSTGGRILDPFRSSLSPRMVEVLVCTQNWLKASPNLDGFCMEDVEHYNQMDELLDSINSKSTEDDQEPNAK
ncbi:zinc finger BED domain-containing RICESLEEPER 2-like [Olea europaea subsp. europaea]|uniref:Zinc finger BED domain-containing RICESLEEPER 2-like n=1 Tax=Olea europaea subsp. europaea TaxID=158383 RepID=A0A8S0V0I4_OLEEU|nr:zinc finger BED domain-containing RICESLEEPER 2-like [Olea europaea subsp. europaea]